MTLNDIRIVDLRASGVDWTKSNRETAKFHFTDKKYINYRGDKSVRPAYLFRWCRNDERTINDWMHKWPGAQLVTTADDYYPEGGTVSPSGNYTFSDVIWMKIPVMAYKEQREKEIRKSEQAPDLIMKGLRAEMAQYGADLTDAELAAASDGINAELAAKMGSRP
jgi:hypothetical protein